MRLLYSALESAGDAIVITDLDGSIQWVNSAFTAMTGYAAEEVIGKNPRVLKSGSTSREVYKNLWSTVRAGEPWRGSLVNRRKDGSTYTEELQITPLFGDGSHVTHFMAIKRDMSERAAAERVLRESEELYKQLFDEAPVAYHEIDRGGMIRRVNRAECELLGYSAEELIGRPVWELVVPAERELSRESVLAKLGGAAVPVPFIRPYQCRNGEIRILENRENLIWTPRGEISGLRTSLVDLTERIRSEDRLAYHAQVLAQVSDSIYATGADQRITYWNQAAEKLSGWKAEEVAGKRIEEVFPWDRATLSAESVRRALAEDGFWAGEVRLRRRGGDPVWVHVRVSELRDSKGAVTGAVTVAHDITLRKDAEAALLQARDAAEEAAKMKSEFLATISHEIRTPMNGIIGMTDLLLDTKLAEDQRGYAEAVRTSSDALLKLINDVLDFSKLEAGKLEIDRVGFDLRATLDEILRLMRPKADAKGLPLSLAYSNLAPHSVVGDPHRVRQIILNFLSNAIKFTERGYVLVDVQPALNDPKSVSISVHDTGIGIAPDKIGLLFRRFSQADSSTTRRFGGTGLGLAITKELAARMGGTVSVSSQVGRGSTFSCTLPMLEACPECGPAGEAAKRAALGALEDKPELPGPQRKVLLVEDNAVNQKVGMRLLQRLGCKVEVATNGLEAVELATRSAYDLVLMDCQMPEMDGFEATARIREIEASQRHTRIIAMTAFAMQGDRQRCLDAGMDDYISKPVQASELRNLLLACSNREP